MRKSPSIFCICVFVYIVHVFVYMCIRNCVYVYLCICAVVYLCSNAFCFVLRTIPKDLLGERAFGCATLPVSVHFVGQTLKGENVGLASLLQWPKMTTVRPTLNDRSVNDSLYHYEKNKRF